MLLGTFEGIQHDFLACQSQQNKGASGPSKALELSSEASTKELLEARENYFVATPDFSTCNQGTGSRHSQDDTVQHAGCDTYGLSIGTENTKSFTRPPQAPIHREAGCVHAQTKRVVEVHSIHYKERSLSTATFLCVALDQDRKRRMRWLEYQGFITTSGAKEAISSFRPTWED